MFEYPPIEVLVISDLKDNNMGGFFVSDHFFKMNFTMQVGRVGGVLA